MLSFFQSQATVGSAGCACACNSVDRTIVLFGSDLNDVNNAIAQQTSFDAVASAVLLASCLLAFLFVCSGWRLGKPAILMLSIGTLTSGAGAFAVVHHEKQHWGFTFPHAVLLAVYAILVIIWWYTTKNELAEIKADIAEIKVRLTAIESRLDRLEHRVDLIEKRLDVLENK